MFFEIPEGNLTRTVVKLQSIDTFTIKMWNMHDKMSTHLNEPKTILFLSATESIHVLIGSLIEGLSATKLSSYKCSALIRRTSAIFTSLCRL